MSSANGSREIALLGIDPVLLNLLSEFLKSYGYACRALADEGEAGAWLKGEGRACPLLIVEARPGGRIPDRIRNIRTRMLSLEPGSKPSELFRSIVSALPTLA